MLTPLPVSNPTAHSALQPATPTQARDAATEQSPPTSSARPEAVKVSFSGLALQKSAAAQKAASNRDIEESGLPDTTQKILKMIRELKQKIEQKQVELQAVMTDQSLDPRTRQLKAAGVQAELGSLTAALTTANTALNKQVKDGVLSAEQGQQAALLTVT